MRFSKWPWFSRSARHGEPRAYPSSTTERALLLAKGVQEKALPTQTDVQLYLVTEVLRMRGSVRLLSKTGASKVGHGVKWREVVSELDLDRLPGYARAVLLRAGA